MRVMAENDAERGTGEKQERGSWDESDRSGVFRRILQPRSGGGAGSSECRTDRISRTAGLDRTL